VPTPSTDIDLAFAAELGQQLRVDSVRSSTSAGSGHPTSSMSAADLMAVLVGRHLRYNWDDPDDPGNDHLLQGARVAPAVLDLQGRRRGL
jgi:transketolase